MRTLSGSTLVRTATVALGQGLCRKGTAISSICWRGPALRTSRTTPTICHSTAAVTAACPGTISSMRRRWARGSASPRNFFTNVSLTTATRGRPARSSSLKDRPFTSRMPKVRK